MSDGVIEIIDLLVGLMFIWLIYLLIGIDFVDVGEVIGSIFGCYIGGNNVLI